MTGWEWLVFAWTEMSWMRWPLVLCATVGTIVIIWKFFSLMGKSASTKKVLGNVNQLLAERKIDQAVKVCRESDSPAAAVLLAGLERRQDGVERVTTAIENQGVLELSRLESGLVVLATLTNVAPLLGFLGTVVGMIVAFQAIELAGEVEATLVAGGIKVALLTTATGLVIAIPTSIFHNYFVSRVDALVIEMEESAQKMIETLRVVDSAH